MDVSSGVMLAMLVVYNVVAVSDCAVHGHQYSSRWHVSLGG